MGKKWGFNMTLKGLLMAVHKIKLLVNFITWAKRKTDKSLPVAIF